MQVGVYIEGFNLYYGGRGLCGKGTPGWRWLDLRALAERVITNHSTWAGATIHRVIYCTAVISGADNPVGNPEQDVYLRALNGCPSYRSDRPLGTYVRRVATAPLATPDRNGRPVLTNPTWPVMVKDGAGQDDPQAQFFVSVALRGCNPPRRAGLTKAAASGPRRQGREAGRRGSPPRSVGTTSGCRRRFRGDPRSLPTSALLFHLLVPGGKWQTDRQPARRPALQRPSTAGRGPLLPPASAVISSRRPRELAAHAATSGGSWPANAAVSWSTPTLTHPSWRHVVDAVRDGLAHRLVHEVVHADLAPAPPAPFPAVVLEIPDQLLLFRVHPTPAARRGTRRAPAVDVAELGVAVGMRAALAPCRWPGGCTPPRAAAAPPCDRPTGWP